LKKLFLKYFCALFFAAALLVPLALAYAEDKVAPDEAEYLYKKYGNAVYQVQVIDVVSGEKTSIGSGFQVNAEGLLATNYHVVAEKIHRPESNRIEYLSDSGDRGSLKIVDVDIINDLAILQMEKAGSEFLNLNKDKVFKGTKIFSIGNPHDIGFTIIEGTYNGIAKDSFIDKIHFSGSLNAGMSGGPAISHEGEVVGINVATAGNQISFLVPVKGLVKLISESRGKDFDFEKNADTEIENQLIDNQNKNVNKILNMSWKHANFGKLSVPAQITDELKCWGGINHTDKDKFKYFYSMCSTQDRIFIDDKFDTGAIAYRYNYLMGKDELNLIQFFNFYEMQYRSPDGDYKNAAEDNVTNFECNDSVINEAGSKWKASFCVRQYKKYPKIYDLHMYMAELGSEKEGFTTALIAQGISKENSLKLAERFVQEVKTADVKTEGESK